MINTSSEKISEELIRELKNFNPLILNLIARSLVDRECPPLELIFDYTDKMITFA
jgi:hypothetical protein